MTDQYYGHRMHFKRQIPGTSQIERLQVIVEAIPPDTIQVTTWSVAGSGKKKKVEKCTGTAELVDDRASAVLSDLADAGWDSTFSQTMFLPPRRDMHIDHLQFKIQADTDLSGDIDTVIGNMSGVDWCIEQDGSFLIGSNVVKLSRSRRKAGEDRPLRLDTINANVPSESKAAAVLAVLAERHGGKVYDDMTNLVKPAPFYATAQMDGLDELLEAFHLKRVAIPSGVLVRPDGHAVMPAVF
ncbi:hypothetical protein [Luteimonas sp. MHLX1A]|uniref:hypothetical protein n=1 Tax=Alterluteimonas muca TaxID=2878684 RepID=UPI001E5271C3|nr:hypothetical protein [Luteimonas sp. MHLX1A]MCD9046917.1 hypothetical protein [Luteimonas sp. MHLX1A]